MILSSNIRNGVFSHWIKAETQSDYVEIKREKKNEGGKDGGEGSGVMEEVEGEKGEEMIGKDVENENGKPVRETDEDTALYSNVKAIIGGE